MNPIKALSNQATALYLRARAALINLRTDDRGMATLEVAIIVTVLLLVAGIVAALIQNAVANHDANIK